MSLRLVNLYGCTRPPLPMMVMLSRVPVGPNFNSHPASSSKALSGDSKTSGTASTAIFSICATARVFSLLPASTSTDPISLYCFQNLPRNSM